MTGQMWLALAMCVSGHVLLHFKAERYYRFAAAWMITGAFLLASGVAIPCFVRCESLQHQITLRAAEPGKRMSDTVDYESPNWSMETSTGTLSFTSGDIKDIPQWPAKPSDSW